MILGAVTCALILALLGHLIVWSLIPPLSPYALARQGGFVSVDGVDTYYERYGSGPPIVLIPPGGAHTSTWRYNIAALSRTHEVWTFDLPGSGYTAKPAAFAYTHNNFAQFVRDFMDKMEISKAVIGGQSLGGTIAIEFTLDYPDRTAGLILIDSGGYSRGGTKLGAFNPLRYPLINAILMSFSSYPPVVKSFYASLYYRPERFSENSALVSEICAINRTPNARIAYYWLQRGLNFDFALPDPNRIKLIETPTLIIWGRQDKVIDLKTAARFHQDIAGSQFLVVNEAGHVTHEEQPDTVNHAIGSFLQSIRW